MANRPEIKENKDRLRLSALANLKCGKSAREVSDLLNIPYLKVVALAKDLEKAERQNTISDLFNLDAVVVDELINLTRESVNSDLVIFNDAASGELLDKELQNVGAGIKNGGILNQHMQEAAIELAKQIRRLTISADNAGAVETLAAALSKLQTSFFAKDNFIQVNGASIDAKKFESFLGD